MKKTMPPTLTHVQYFVLRVIERLGKLATFNAVRRRVIDSLAFGTHSEKAFRSVILDALEGRGLITINPNDPLARATITEAGHEALQYSCQFYQIKEDPCQSENFSNR